MAPSSDTLALTEQGISSPNQKLALSTETMMHSSPPAKTTVAITVTPPPPPNKPTGSSSSSSSSSIITLADVQTMTRDQLSPDVVRFIMKDQPADLQGSPTRTTTHSVQGYAGLWFRSYEHAAACKSAFNQQYINIKLGLISHSPTSTKPASSASAASKRTSVRAIKKDRKFHTETPTRTSRRIARLAAPEPMVLPEDVRGKTIKRQLTKRPPRRVAVTAFAPLTIEQLTKLRAYCESQASWLETFDTYLTRVEQISAANKRNVLRQAKLLVAGKCIGYSHWEEGVAFNQAGIRYDLGKDLVQLLSDADDFEREHGRDLGNGWLMRHPIQKLINYQRYALEKLEQAGTATSL